MAASAPCACERHRRIQETYGIYYSRDDYPKSKRAKAYTLHYLIALNQPLESFRKAIGSHGERLTVQDPMHHWITPLALAVLFNRPDAIRFLLDRKVSPRQTNEWGFSPLHYAALEGREQEFLSILETIKDRQTDRNLFPPAVIKALKEHRDEYGGTFEDLIALTREEAPSDGAVAQFQKKDGEMIPLSAEDFDYLTGFPFRSRYRVTVPDLIRLHSNWEEIERVLCFGADQTLKIGPRAFEPFEKEPPKLYLYAHDKMGLGVKTAVPIARGEVASVFIGTMTDCTPQKWKNTLRFYKYAMNSVDPTEGTNITPFINDGPPDLCIIPSVPRQGLPCWQTVVALRDILPGEALYHNYGPSHCVKQGPYTIEDAAYKRLQQTFKELDKAGPKDNWPQELMVRYVFETPYAFIRVHLDGTVLIERTQRHLTADILAESSNPLAPLYHPLLTTLQKIHHYQQTSKALEFLERLTVRTCVELFGMFQPDEEISSSENMDMYFLMGKLFDQLYLYYNDTAEGTLVGDDDASECEKETLDFAAVIEKFGRLPSRLQQTFKEKIEKYIDLSRSTNTCSEKREGLEKLLQCLAKSM